MASVPQKVLNWLSSVLQPQYADVSRAYNDVAVTLQQWPSLRPSTDVFTFESGRSALLLRLVGTIPVVFRGTTYSIPITLWVTYEYPRDPPMVFVTPTPGKMAIRPSQSVSAEGRVYLPYLAQWGPDRSALAQLVGILQEVFAREPPVVAVQSGPAQAHPQQQGHNSAPPLPPLPPELSRAGSVRQDGTPSPAQPPALPPKPGQERQAASPAPMPPQRPSLADERAQPDRPSQQDPRRQSSSGYNPRYNAPPPLPPQPGQQRPAPGYEPRRGPQPPSGVQDPRWQNAGPPAFAGPPQQQPPNNYHQPQQHPGHPYQPPPSHQQQYAPLQYAQQSQPRKPSPPRDLLSDPFDPPLPAHSEPLPAPPIPPNPEKDALLRTLSHTLTTRLHAALQTNEAALPPLRAQHQALNAALGNLHREQQALTTLASHINSNSEILTQAMRGADACIARAQTATAPGVDEVLTAPTVVGQQLYELVAELQALAGAREVLSRAFDRGRVGAESWVKSVRGLAREEFLKRVLVEKAARGMGLQGEAGREEGGWL